MVQAILNGRKTQTRRVSRVQTSEPANGQGYLYCRFHKSEHKRLYSHEEFIRKSIESAKYKIGDILYVRETWRNQPREYNHVTNEYSDFEYQYRADFTDEENACYGRRGGLAPWKWKPSIHMPKAAARTFLCVTDVRVERLHDISEADAEAEGAYKANWNLATAKPGDKIQPPTFINGFANLWDGINAKRGFGWEDNPWVWVYEFERIEKQ